MPVILSTDKFVSHINVHFIPIGEEHAMRQKVPYSLNGKLNDIV